MQQSLLKGLCPPRQASQACITKATWHIHAVAMRVDIIHDAAVAMVIVVYNSICPLTLLCMSFV